MMPVGQALAGPSASALGTENVLMVAGVMSLVVAATLLAVRPIRDLERADAPTAGSIPAGEPERARAE